MSTKKSSKAETTTLSPRETSNAIRLMIPTKRTMFLWGPPGIAKSAIAQQEANLLGIAFVDIRLSQMDPTDLRGIPVPVNDGITQGVFWSPPIALPKNLNIQKVIEIDAIDTMVYFASANPKGSNGIHYVRKPVISVKALNREHTARIVAETLDSFAVIIEDASGNPVGGKLQYTITGDAHALIALEEFNSAPLSVQAAAYQLLLDRALGEYKVPEGCILIAMGNRDTDKGVTFKMPTPVANRVVHIEMRHEFEDWQLWAFKDLVHPDVIGYLSAFKHHLFDFDAGTASRGFATPRSWNFVSDILKANADLPQTEGMALIMGSIGDGIGVQFWEFRNVAADLPKAADILTGKIKEMPANKKAEISLAYALTTTLCYELKERNDALERKGIQRKDKGPERAEWFKEADNFLAFIMNNFSPEIAIMGAKAGISVHKLPFDTQKMKNFDTFASKYKDVIMGS